MRLRDYAGHVLRDYPNAIRMRGLGFAVPVPPGFGSGDARPVVLIPGVYERWQFLRAIGLQLSERGHPVHVLRELGINTAPIPASAERVLAILAARDLRDVAVVAHSKGGLIGKSAMLADADHRIDRLVALASPFSGSRMADLMPNPALRAFRPAHPVIRMLAGETGVNARITSIYPAFDPHVPEGSEMAGATNVRLGIVGHFRILEDPAAIAAVVAAVERDG